MSDEFKPDTTSKNEQQDLPPVDMMDLLEGDLPEDEGPDNDAAWAAMQDALNEATAASEAAQTASPQDDVTAIDTEAVTATDTGQPTVEDILAAAEAQQGDNELMAKLEQVRAEAEEYKQGWQRARAEFANFRKRVDRERTTLYQEASLDVIARLLPIIDDFERAMLNVPTDIDDHDWVKGVSLIRQKLNTLLDSYDLEEINPVGEPFDPMFHEAVGVDQSDEIASEHVTMVLQKGYAWGDRVVRPAMVRVAN